MKIQSISLLMFSGKNKKNSKPSSLLIRASMPKSQNDRFERKNLLVTTKGAYSSSKEVNNEINEYLNDSIKEVKNMEKAAKAYYNQFCEILILASFVDYKNSIKIGNRNIIFDKNNETERYPSTINIWEDGRFIRQGRIKQIKPTIDMEIYDCKNAGSSEEFSISDKKLISYVSKEQKKNKIKMIMPTEKGFYKAEGKISSKGTFVNSLTGMKKVKELTYDPSGFSYYTEYKESGDLKYCLKNEKWELMD